MKSLYRVRFLFRLYIYLGYLFFGLDLLVGLGIVIIVYICEVDRCILILSR